MNWKLWRRKPKVPNPGSREAAMAGCPCPIHINNAGKEKPKQGWVIRSNCTMHAQLAPRAKRVKA